jgi:hypothetical protein
MWRGSPITSLNFQSVICFLKKKNISCGKGDRYSENNQPPQYDQVQMSSNNYPYSVQNDKNKQRVKFSEPGTTFTKQQMMENLTLVRLLALLYLFSPLYISCWGAIWLDSVCLSIRLNVTTCNRKTF